MVILVSGDLEGDSSDLSNRTFTERDQPDGCLPVLMGLHQSRERERERERKKERQRCNLISKLNSSVSMSQILAVPHV